VAKKVAIENICSSIFFNAFYSVFFIKMKLTCFYVFLNLQIIVFNIYELYTRLKLSLLLASANNVQCFFFFAGPIQDRLLLNKFDLVGLHHHRVNISSSGGINSVQDGIRMLPGKKLGVKLNRGCGDFFEELMIRSRAAHCT